MRTAYSFPLRRVKYLGDRQTSCRKGAKETDRQQAVGKALRRQADKLQERVILVGGL